MVDAGRPLGGDVVFREGGAGCEAPLDSHGTGASEGGTSARVPGHNVNGTPGQPDRFIYRFG